MVRFPSSWTWKRCVRGRLVEMRVDIRMVVVLGLVGLMMFWEVVN